MVDRRHRSYRAFRDEVQGMAPVLPVKVLAKYITLTPSTTHPDEYGVYVAEEYVGNAHVYDLGPVIFAAWPTAWQ